MKKVNRDINDIINELVAHPDYIHHEIWTKASVVDLVCRNYDLETIESGDVIEEILSNDDYEDIGLYIENCYEWTFNDTFYEYPDDLDKRINRAIKLENLTKYSDNLDEDDFDF